MRKRTNVTERPPPQEPLALPLAAQARLTPPHYCTAKRKIDYKIKRVIYPLEVIMQLMFRIG